MKDILKKRKKMLISIGCVALLMLSWIITIGAKSNEERQLELMNQATRLMHDGIYVRAVPLLEEAAGYSTKYTLNVEGELKRAYIALFDTHGYRSKYVGLLERQLGRRDAPAEIFIEAANYYLSIQRISDAFEIFRTGIERTNCAELIEMYENNRYVYEINRVGYDFAADIHGGAAIVQRDGAWGMVYADGSLMIPCMYEQISTFYSDRAIVSKNSEIFAVDINNNRLALLHENAVDFGLGFAENRFPLFVEGAWRRTTGDFIIGTAQFEEIGMYSQGYAAAKVNGRWGVIDKDMNWLIPAEHDDIIRDEFGRCYAQGAVFIKKGASVYLYIDGKQTTSVYDNAKPFSNEGFAAVERNGKWGFIDNQGIVMIDFVFDDALSFGQHLAAVRVGDFWGYICVRGNIVIEPVFLEAKSFASGSAPVLTERGWDFITLLEYR